MAIRCERELCIYQWNNQCMLDEISLNPLGICSDCLCIEIPPAQRDTLKRELLQRYIALE